MVCYTTYLNIKNSLIRGTPNISDFGAHPKNNSGAQEENNSPGFFGVDNGLLKLKRSV